ncbi:hypothetical protein VP01_544g1 [Puccinia sorghi]|uniref:Uncharacterized protein n=1 Tax=Puccinia sorghi TaxID=27349 RepID=A0A0L6UJN6_9BASI|nr:hypothetical protein VP01_544g1 [Puccinia sorghi]
MLVESCVEPALDCYYFHFFVHWFLCSLLVGWLGLICLLGHLFDPSEVKLFHLFLETGRSLEGSGSGPARLGRLDRVVIFSVLLCFRSSQAGRLTVINEVFLFLGLISSWSWFLSVFVVGTLVAAVVDTGWVEREVVSCRGCFFLWESEGEGLLFDILLSHFSSLSFSLSCSMHSRTICLCSSVVRSSQVLEIILNELFVMFQIHLFSIFKCGWCRCNCEVYKIGELGRDLTGLASIRWGVEISDGSFGLRVIRKKSWDMRMEGEVLGMSISPGRRDIRPWDYLYNLRAVLCDVRGVFAQKEKTGQKEFPGQTQLSAVVMPRAVPSSYTCCKIGHKGGLK